MCRADSRQGGGAASTGLHKHARPVHTLLTQGKRASWAYLQALPRVLPRDGIADRCVGGGAAAASRRLHHHAAPPRMWLMTGA